VSAWGGGALRQVSAHLILHGGGHGDYGGNEIYALGLADDAPRWQRIWGPTPNAQITPQTDRYADGNPPSVHTYFYLQYDRFADRLMSVGSGQYITSGVNRLVHSWNWMARDWNPQSAHPAIPGGGYPGAGTAMHPITGDIYVWNATFRGQWARATNTWPYSDAFTNHQRWENSAVVDPARNCVWSFGGYGAVVGEVDRWDLASNVVSTQAVTGTGTSAVQEHGIGAARDPTTGMIWLYDRNARLYRFDPTALTLTLVPTTGSAPGTNASYGNPNGIWGRLQLVEAWRTLVVVPAWAAPVFAIRLP